MAHRVKSLTRKRMRTLLNLKRKKRLPTVALIAQVIEQSSGEHFFEIGFRGSDGKMKSIRVAREDVLHHPAKIRDLLSRFGAVLPSDQKLLQSLIKELSVAAAPNFWAVTPTFGWQEGRKTFILPKRVLGSNGDGKLATTPKLVPPDRLNAIEAVMQRKGKLAAWKNEAAAMARHSSTIALALSAAFAAPLLAVVGWPTFMIVLFGPGKVGKSTAALAGASMFGIGREEGLPNWNQTEAALPEVVSQFNDLMLVLNGLETAKLKDRQLREFLQSVTYILSDGVETRRHSSWSAGRDPRPTAVWRTIALVTSEQSFDEIASRANEVRLDGERARAINVAAKGANDSTIIDFYPKDLDGNEVDRKAWARQRVDALRAACAQHHGVALKPYLAHLIEKDQAKLKDEVNVARDKFVESVKAHTTAEALNHAAKNMGLVYAGGVQAIQAGLLPLTEEQLLKRIRKCFLRSIIPWTPDKDPMHGVLQQLDNGLREAVLNIESAEVSERFRVTKGQWGDEFTVHARGLFSIWFSGKQTAQSAALRWLCDESLLVVRDCAAAVAARFTIDSVRHTRRIKGKNCAAIVFRDPRRRLSEVLAGKAMRK
jgi:hypothetical protein